MAPRDAIDRMAMHGEIVFSRCNSNRLAMQKEKGSFDI